MKNDDMAILKTMLMTWTDEQVSVAWNLVATEGAARRTASTKAAKLMFKEGDAVSFSGRRSGSVTGTIAKVKRTKALVDVPGSQRWDVPLSMLTKVNP